ncbi:MAG: FAD:protein FMN transferase, partial [Caulobacteraceae bacterium]|nr:FAD:protein FMN transferase [Caulobacter sp.]
MPPLRAPHAVRLTALLAAAAAAVGGAARAAPARTFHAEHVLGTSLDVTVVGASPTAARRAAAAARAEIERLDALLSAWRPDAELARVNAGPDAVLAPEL